MTPVGSINPLSASALTRLDGPDVTTPKIGLQATNAPATEGFSKMLDGVISMVDTKQAESQAMTRKVLLGESDSLHQSVIAMQEAGVAFSLMVEVRNKLVDSYQELMRMQV
jgi:flagellar hook-basal body complex protein FliE